MDLGESSFAAANDNDDDGVKYEVLGLKPAWSYMVQLKTMSVITHYYALSTSSFLCCCWFH